MKSLLDFEHRAIAAWCLAHTYTHLLNPESQTLHSLQRKCFHLNSAKTRAFLPARVKGFIPECFSGGTVSVVDALRDVPLGYSDIEFCPTCLSAMPLRLRIPRTPSLSYPTLLVRKSVTYLEVPGPAPRLDFYSLFKLHASLQAG